MSLTKLILVVHMWLVKLQENTSCLLLGSYWLTPTCLYHTVAPGNFLCRLEGCPLCQLMTSFFATSRLHTPVAPMHSPKMFDSLPWRGVRGCQRGGAFSGGPSDKEPAGQSRRCKRLGFDPWVGKIPWRRKWQPIPVFLPGKSRGQRSLAGYHP